MVSTNFFVSILFCYIGYVLSAEELSCHLHEDGLYDGKISVTYDRDELSIYKYNDTKFVNFLLRDMQLVFDGVFPDENEKKYHVVGIKTNVEGIAKLQEKNGCSKYYNIEESISRYEEEKNEKESSLTACHYNLRKNAKLVDNVNSSVQVRIIEMAHDCIKSKLCQNLGNIQQDDYIRAKIDHYDFGENSVMYDIFAEKYPNFNLPDAMENNLQHTINLLADFGVASLITQMSKKQLGQIEIPDVDETIRGVPLISQGYFRLSDGTFGNLRNVTRSKDVTINHKGLEFTLQAEFKILKANIHFDKYALKYGIVDTCGKIDIKIDEVTFYIKVAINYNNSPCEITVPAMESKIGNVSFELSQNGIFDKVINEVTTNIVNRYTSNIINLIENKIKEAIKEPLEKFGCEKFRP